MRLRSYPASVHAPWSTYASKIFPTKIVWSPVVIWSSTSHSMCAMHSRIAGALTFLPGSGVSVHFLNLSKLLPDNEPQVYTA